METLSVWRGGAPAPGYAMLAGDVTADVVIIGGGITGVTLAYLLAKQGRQVVLLEADTLGSGATGNSTGNLYETLSRGLREVVDRWGAEVGRRVREERRTAMAFIEAHAQGAAQAGFRRCPLTLYATTAGAQADIDKEYDALTSAGAQVRRTTDIPAPLPAAAGAGLVLEDQAQIQPQGYVVQLAAQAVQAGAHVHEHTRVLEIDGDRGLVATASGAVKATEIVMATHTPKGLHILPHAQMPVHREYGIALPGVPPALANGIFWCKGDESLSVRATEAAGQPWLVCVGQEQVTGKHNAKAALMALEARAARHFGGAQPLFRWSAQNYRSADALPYIGRDGAGRFIATGFATDGLVWGTVAARLIAAELNGHAAAFAELCRPQRISPLKGAKTLLEETRVTVQALVEDYLTHPQGEHLARLAPGDSAILEADGADVAAWRSPQGELFAVSSVCTHMGCKVHWNSVETSWDCPCHGSRFRPDGTVIEGPAIRPLARKQAPL
jgi:glycine/D-amino acid oxidase-like deaminating enzyme/nitrite reductase/ring-hydroxylating ferredoxin subunit